MSSSLSLQKPSAVRFQNISELYSRLKFLGKGSYGSVFRAERNGKEVALKMQLHIDEQLQNEINILLMLSKKCHPNVICYNDFFETDFKTKRQYVIETEFIDGVLLSERPWQTALQQFAPAEFAVRVTRGLLNGLTFMHSHKVYHLDIKPDNIMLRNNGEPVFIDLGLSCAKDCDKIAGGGSSLYFSLGRAYCIQMQKLCSNQEKEKGDVWALMLSLVEAFTDEEQSQELLNDLADVTEDKETSFADRAKYMHQLLEAYQVTNNGFYPLNKSVDATLKAVLLGVVNQQIPTANVLATNFKATATKKYEPLSAKLHEKVLMLSGLAPFKPSHQ